MKALISTAFLSVLAITISFSQTKPKAKAASAATGGISASINRGKTIYLQYCLSCHQMDGGGVPNMNPPLIKTTYVTGDKGKLVKIILNGFTDHVDIKGESYSNTMPSHSFLKDQEIADVLTYVRNSFGNKGTAVKVTEVKVLRAAVKK